MTLSKLAQLANVSVSVVSRAFSGKGDISDAMREHVFTVAREHGCFQKFYHASYDKPVVAVIIPEAISKYYIHYIETLKKDIEENGYTMLLSISNFDPQMRDELVRYYTEHGKVDGLIVIEAATFPKNCKTALISLTNKPNGTGACISYDKETGLVECVKLLKERGHRNIAFVGEALTNSQMELVRRTVEAAGLQARGELFYSSRLRFEEAGKDGVRAFWSNLIEKPTAIIGAYGYITQGILEELETMGLRVPEDVSVISMDSDPFPLHPTLDVACIPSGIDEICEQAMKLLHERIRTDEPNALCHVKLPSTFHVGNTVR